MRPNRPELIPIADAVTGQIRFIVHPAHRTYPSDTSYSPAKKAKAANRKQPTANAGGKQ